MMLNVFTPKFVDLISASTFWIHRMQIIAARAAD